MKAQFAPMDIAIIIIMLIIGALIIFLTSFLIPMRDLSLALKVEFTNNEADLALLSLLPLNYSQSSHQTIYERLSLKDLYPIDTDENFKKSFTNMLNKSLNWKLKCFELRNKTSVLISYGNCYSFDYKSTFCPIYKPGGLTEEIMLEYNKVVG